MHASSPSSRSVIRLLSCAVAVLAAGCVNLRSTSAPMFTQTDASQCTVRADTLIVMLPGVFSYPEEFVREGFVKAVQDERLAVDIVRVDAHLGYYEKNAFVERLRADVIAPARARGYRAVWIFGISLGGFGGLIYAQEHPDEIAGVVALAPYLGNPELAESVEKAGGLMRWNAPLVSAADERSKREAALWTSLKSYGAAAATAQPRPLPQLWLGYGKADKFARSNGLLGAVLPPERVFTTEGAHDWAPWLRLWKAALPELPLPRCAS